MPEPAGRDQASEAQASTELLRRFQALEARCVRHAVGLPAREPPPRIWTMVVFRMVGQTVLAPLEQVAEVLIVPSQVTRVPGTKSWVHGVANNRGTLLPIYDIDNCLTDMPSRRTTQERVLVVRQEELPFGVLVGGPVGIHHCQATMAVEVSPDAYGALSPLLDGGYLRGTEPLPVVNLTRLPTLPPFGSAAA